MTTAGLLPGQDIAQTLENQNLDVVLIPAESLNDSDIFVDNYSFGDLREQYPNMRIIAAHEITSALS